LRKNAMAEKIVVFGAGATGRGHVGLLAWQAGFEVVFVDKKRELVDALARRGRYVVKLYGGKGDSPILAETKIGTVPGRQL
jgi:mannitol-1-phosphate/altronate dehydrogenase